MIVIKSRPLRSVLRRLIPFVLIPALVAVSALVFKEKRYILISLGIVVLSLLLFLSGVEKKNIGSRRMVIIAAMTALSVVGRLIPFLKPVTALTVITAMYLGAESGFLVGALSAFLSNFIFGQGPWTPFQMFAWGLCGLFAGYLARLLVRSRAALMIYGALSGIMFSLIMDVWTVLWYSGSFEPAMYLAALLSSLPFTLLYAVSNCMFLLLIRKPFGEKLQRIKVKYGV